MPNGIQAAMVRGDNHSDQGCHLAPSCLNCPFPVCYLDDPKAVESARAATEGAGGGEGNGVPDYSSRR